MFFKDLGQRIKMTFTYNTKPEHNNGSTLADGLAKFYNKNSFNDFELKCGDETFPCLKVILASRSDIFEAMFSQVSISSTFYDNLFVQSSKCNVTG